VLALVSGVLVGASLAGCYASTEPATDVGIDKATLNARGTANNGPARSWFEYELNGRVGDPPTTATLSWPAGASGPFKANVSGLAAGTEYAYRVCGQDQGAVPVCANTRTFTTKPPVEDAVSGFYAFSCCSSVGVNARSGPSGEHPQGSMTWRRSGGFDPVSYSYTGFVTCVDVEGSSAVVASLGQLRESPPNEPSTESLASMVMTVEDGHQAADTVGWLNPGSASESYPCDPDYVDFPGPIPAEYEFVVNDAEPSSPTAR
jgi:hypothetical protein